MKEERFQCYTLQVKHFMDKENKEMKKTKLLWLSMALIGTVTAFTACGDDERVSRHDTIPSQVATEDATDPDTAAEVPTEAPFGAKVAAQYPISDEMQKKLDTLDTDYSKVNWLAQYAPADNEGIIVSETKYEFNGFNHFVIAYTNLTDEGVQLSFEGYAENTSGEIVKDIIESDVELGPSRTICRDYVFKPEAPSGEITWNSFTVTPSDKEYLPFVLTSKLETKENGTYFISYTEESDVLLDGRAGYGCVLDSEGNIIIGDEEGGGQTVVFSNVESFGGKNADVAFFQIQGSQK